jgi:hypothetical protein
MEPLIQRRTVLSVTRICSASQAGDAPIESSHSRMRMAQNIRATHTPVNRINVTRSYTLIERYTFKIRLPTIALPR